MSDLIEKLEALKNDLTGTFGIDPLYITKSAENNGINAAIALFKEHTEGNTLAPNGWIDAAECYNNCIDGAYYEGGGEPVQCQWCYEKQALILKATSPIK